MDSQMKRGVLSLCLLLLISKQDSYGYDLVKAMQSYFPETDESTLYSILRRLNADGITELYYSDVSGGPQRKYHRITERGRIYLKDHFEEWKQIDTIIKEISRKYEGDNG